MPLVSVIVPNYNHEKFLKQRLDSVINQTFQDFELIILDDYSPDNSKSIIEQYRNHPKVSHIIYNKTNSGSTFKQWNKGIDLATGTYIWIAESDDWAENNFLEVMVGKLDQNIEIGIGYSNSIETDENNIKGKLWSRWQEVNENNIWVSDFNKSGIEINMNFNNTNNVIPNASCVLFRKKLYLDSPKRYSIEKLKYTGDWWMWFSIFENTQVYYFHTPLNYFRCHEFTTRSNSNFRFLKAFEHYDAIYQFKNIKTLKSKHLDTKLNEIFDIWNPSLRSFFKQESLMVLYLALKVDSKLLQKLFKIILSKF